jgi:16S rRNA (cytidine1402-2'-O)-methyltransferase
MGEKTALKGVLYVVATPIGNLGDMVPRAVETLQQVDCIACEDTRHSRRLLDHFHISRPLLSYHEHNEDRVVSQLLSRLQQGESVALISDAGTPLISDPGYPLIRAAHDNNVPVVPIPGPSALIAALSASGLPSDRFVFEGFLPAKEGQRQTRLQQLSRETRTLIFYEAPHRIVSCLADMVAIMGADREAVMARELTKTHETLRLLPLGELQGFVSGDHNQQKGEIVILIRGYQQIKHQQVDPEAERILKLLNVHLPPRQAANLTAEITGVDKKSLYDHLKNSNV